MTQYCIDDTLRDMVITDERWLEVLYVFERTVELAILLLRILDLAWHPVVYAGGDVMWVILRMSRERYVVSFEPDGICEQMGPDEAIAWLRSYCIPFAEIEAAMTSLVANGHDYAEIGINLRFTYSRKAVVPEMRAA